jgi:hypothetical protein
VLAGVVADDQGQTPIWLNDIEAPDGDLVGIDAAASGVYGLAGMALPDNESDAEGEDYDRECCGV